MGDDAEREVEERVRARAYALWDQDGRPEGRSDEYWQRAWKEMEAELLREQDQVLKEAHGTERRRLE